jgi:hypothetical protein
VTIRSHVNSSCELEDNPSLEALLVLPHAARLDGGDRRGPHGAHRGCICRYGCRCEALWVLLAYGQRLIGVALERSLVETPASRSNASVLSGLLDLKAP